MLTILLSVAIAAGTFYYLFVRPMDYWKKRGVHQGNPIWFFGDIFRNFIALENFTISIDEAYKEAGKRRYFGIYQLTQPTLIIKDPKLIKQMTVKDFDHFMDHRPLVSEEVDPLWGKNLVELKGDKWKLMRSKMSPVFTSSKLKVMFGSMSECAESFVKYYTEMKKDLIELDSRDDFARCINDVISKSAFGVTVNSLKERDNEFYLTATEATNLNSFRFLFVFFASLFLPFKIMKFLGLRVFSEKVSSFFRDVVDETVKIRQEKGIVLPDMIHLLLESRKTGNSSSATASGYCQGNNITNTDILAQAMIFLLGGFDTLSRTLIFTCYELALNKTVQDKLRKEILETKNADDGKITYESISNMNYMDMVISESLRKYPTMSAITRICTAPLTIEPVNSSEKPLFIEEGTGLWFPVYSIHRDPENFKDPDVFDPERFSDENKDNIDPYTFIPFGVGPRNCIGNRFSNISMKVIISHLLSNFELIPTKKTPDQIIFSKKSVFITPDTELYLAMIPLTL